jgi:hypothetical protein
MSAVALASDRPLRFETARRSDVAAAAERLAFAGIGALPVTLIAATAFRVADLRVLAVGLLLPALLLGAVIASRNDGLRRVVPAALVAGLVATAFYDLFRVGFLAVGLMQHDPIPHIGAALHLRPAWAVGYTWRYIGNGGGLSVAFFALGLRGVRAGALYGLAVCAGLLVTLAVSPDGQALLFPLNPTTVVMATGGHLIYGSVLGRLAGAAKE